MCDETEDGFMSEEDMFSPKKCSKPASTEVLVEQLKQPGTKERLLNTFKRMLTGIPPPPDFTNPDFHLDKLLTTWKENQNLLWEQSENYRENSDNGVSPLGICLNEDTSCEQFELMGRQICSRFIWCETAAVTSQGYIKLTQSAKKRRKANGWGLSPRTRISYLTRRMTTFQRDNIASAVASSKTTQILVNKNDVKGSTTSKGPALRGKRALFQSPENQNKFRTPEQGKNRRLARRLVLNSSPPSNSRGSKSIDRTMTSSEKKRCSRSLFTSATEPPVNQVQQKNNNALSTQHRQKMLWAVSNALKTVKIRMSDPQFKNFASLLFKATTDKWRLTSNPTSGDKKISTSDSMLATAKSLVEAITGRRMSPKSVKKSSTTPSKSRTPDKSVKRDENNPPTDNLDITTSKLVEVGVYPLEHVGVLAEKLDPGGNASRVRQNPFTSPSKCQILGSIIEESPEISPQVPNLKRKRDDADGDGSVDSVVPCSRVLRTRTPSKFVESPDKSVQRRQDRHEIASSSLLSPSKIEIQQNPPSSAKKRKLDTTTPQKTVTEPRRFSPRITRSRTPSKMQQAEFCRGSSKKLLFAADGLQQEGDDSGRIEVKEESDGQIMGKSKIMNQGGDVSINKTRSLKKSQEAVDSSRHVDVKDDEDVEDSGRIQVKEELEDRILGKSRIKGQESDASIKKTRSLKRSHMAVGGLRHGDVEDDEDVEDSGRIEVKEESEGQIMIKSRIKNQGGGVSKKTRSLKKSLVVVDSLGHGGVEGVDEGRIEVKEESEDVQITPKSKKGCGIRKLARSLKKSQVAVDSFRHGDVEDDEDVEDSGRIEVKEESEDQIMGKCRIKNQGGGVSKKTQSLKKSLVVVDGLEHAEVEDDEEHVDKLRMKVKVELNDVLTIGKSRFNKQEGGIGKRIRFFKKSQVAVEGSRPTDVEYVEEVTIQERIDAKEKREEVSKAPVLRAEGLRRTSRRISAEIVPPVLMMETTLSSPPPLDWILSDWASPKNGMPAPPRRQSGATPAESSEDTEGQSPNLRKTGRRKVSLSLAGSAKKESPPVEKI